MFWKKSKDTPLDLLFIYTQESIDFLNKWEKLDNDGKIEVILFDTALAKHLLKKNINTRMYYNIFRENEYEVFIDRYLYSKMKLYEKLEDPFGFTISRGLFYEEIIEGMSSIENWQSSKIYYLFYVNPLSENPNPIVDKEELFKFQLYLASMITIFSEAVDELNNI